MSENNINFDKYHFLEILMNYYWEEYRIKRQTDKALTDALIGPWGIV